MAMLETLKLWHNGTTAWQRNERTEALAELNKITEPDAKILYNIATVHLTLGNLREARQTYTLAIGKDVHSALTYFQRGLAQYQLGRYADALTDFEDAESRMRGKKFIDYTQLGLRYKLHGCEVMYNAALCHYKLGNREMGAQVMEDAKAGITEKKHVAITEGAAKIQMGQEAKLVGTSNTVLFQPSKNKVANLSKKDYLGTAKVVSSLDSTDATSGFAGPNRIDQVRSSPNSPDNRRKLSTPNIVMHRASSPTDMNGSSKNQGTTKGIHSELAKMMLQTANFGRRLSGPELEGSEDITRSFAPCSNLDTPPPPANTNRRGTAPQLGDLKAVHDIPRVVVDDTDAVPPLYPPPRPPMGSTNAPSRPLPGPPNTTPPPRPPKKPSPPASPTSVDRDESPSLTNIPPPRPTSAKPISRSPRLGRRATPRPASPRMPNGSNVTNGTTGAGMPPPPDRPPPKLVKEPAGGNRAPPPPFKSPKPQKVIVKFTCNTTENVQVERGESVQSLLETAQQLFKLEPNTFNLWSRDTDQGEWGCILCDSDMLKIWSQPQLIQLWCFNKE